MATATPVQGAITVEYAGGIGGAFHLAVAIDSDDPYRSFKKLPDAVEYEGRVYGKTGYDSDRNRAYYSTGARIARAIRKGN
jgi:hypothetical protein